MTPLALNVPVSAPAPPSGPITATGILLVSDITTQQGGNNLYRLNMQGMLSLEIDGTGCAADLLVQFFMLDSPVGQPFVRALRAGQRELFRFDSPLDTVILSNMTGTFLLPLGLSGILAAAGGRLPSTTAGYLIISGSDGSVGVDALSSTVTIGGTAAVTIANSPTVNVGNTPSVVVSNQPSVTVPGNVGVVNGSGSPFLATGRNQAGFKATYTAPLNGTALSITVDQSLQNIGFCNLDDALASVQIVGHQTGYLYYSNAAVPVGSYFVAPLPFILLDDLTLDFKINDTGSGAGKRLYVSVGFDQIATTLQEYGTGVPVVGGSVGVTGGSVGITGSVPVTNVVGTQLSVNRPTGGQVAIPYTGAHAVLTTIGTIAIDQRQTALTFLISDPTVTRIRIIGTTSGVPYIDISAPNIPSNLSFVIVPIPIVFDATLNVQIINTSVTAQNFFYCLDYDTVAVAPVLGAGFNPLAIQGQAGAQPVGVSKPYVDLASYAYTGPITNVTVGSFTPNSQYNAVGFNTAHAGITIQLVGHTTGVFYSPALTIAKAGIFVIPLPFVRASDTLIDVKVTDPVAGAVSLLLSWVGENIGVQLQNYQLPGATIQSEKSSSVLTAGATGASTFTIGVAMNLPKVIYGVAANIVGNITSVAAADIANVACVLYLQGVTTSKIYYVGTESRTGNPMSGTIFHYSMSINKEYGAPLDCATYFPGDTQVTARVIIAPGDLGTAVAPNVNYSFVALRG